MTLQDAIKKWESKNKVSVTSIARARAGGKLKYETSIKVGQAIGYTANETWKMLNQDFENELEKKK